MRVKRPGSLAISRESLLLDARERLAERLPAWAAPLAGDPLDPGWMLLEEAAFMVEALSEQLDQHPFAALQQFLHLSGASLLPALPAVGAVALAPAAAGMLREARPGDLRLLSAQTETRDAIAFTLAEPAVPLRPGLVSSLVELRGGAIQRVGRAWGEGAVGELVRRRGPPSPSEALAEERIVFTLVSASPDRTLAAAREAIARLAEEGPGWLGLSVARGDGGAIELSARVDLSGVFRQGAPGGQHAGGDLVGRWGDLPGSRWAPAVRVADDPRLPLALRGAAPPPGPQDGTLLLPDLPAHLPTAGLLVREPAPIPPGARDAIWRAIAAMHLDLAAIRPSVRHRVEPVRGPGEPRWLEAALGSGEWERILEDGLSVAEIRLPAAARGPGPLRVAVLRAEEAGIRALGLEAGGAMGPLPVQPRWRLPAGGKTFSTLEIELSEVHEGLLLVSASPLEAVCLNPALVLNAPVVQDGRRVLVERGVPEAVSLRAEDLVGPDVLARAVQGALPPETRALLGRLPLGLLTLSSGDELRDLSGVGLDESAGLLTLNAPDARGHLHRLRRGESVTVGWYRRTDGASGDLEEGEIAHVEQRAGDRPRLLAVSNPIPTRGGQDREREEEAMERLFGAPADLPVLASDWERLLRQALLARGRGWVLRVWTYAERTLLQTRLWPLDGGPEQLALRQALADAGPDTLLVVLGPSDRPISEAELSWARETVDAAVERVRARAPALRRALLTPFWGLSLEGSAELPPTPCWDSALICGALVDPRGRRAPCPPSGLLLNAAVVRSRAEEGWGS